MSVTSHLKVTKRVALAAALAAGLAVTGTSSVMAAGGSSARSPQEGGSAPAVSKSVTPGVSPSAVATKVCRGGRHKRSAVATAGTPQILTGSTPVNLLSSPLVVATGRDNDTLILTLSAETQLRGNTDGALFDWLLGTILVDGVAVTDIGPDQLALTGASTYSSNAAQACLRVKPGFHRIQVRGAVITNGSSVGEQAWIDDIVLRADVLE